MSDELMQKMVLAFDLGSGGRGDWKQRYEAGLKASLAILSKPENISMEMVAAFLTEADDKIGMAFIRSAEGLHIRKAISAAIGSLIK